MKAVVYDKNAKPKGMFVREVERPAPGENEVLIEVHAAALNAGDYRVIQMGIAPKHGIVGGAVAGKIAAAGKNVLNFKPGDEVAADISNAGFGGLAEFALVPQSELVRKPAGLSNEDAAALPVAGTTALHALRNKGGLQSGQSVLIYGAGGGVGTYAVQLTKHFGADVTAVCGPASIELVKSLGADRVIDYTREDFLKLNKQYDLILGVNGHQPLSVYRKALKPKGVFVLVGGTIRQLFTVMLFGKLMSLGGKKFEFLSSKSNPEDLRFLMGLMAEGKIKPAIGRVYPLEEAPEALRLFSQGHTKGKVVINCQRIAATS
jgi:NADPH:quinone reductase-like Zn-dependent oxidoreductase